MTAKSIAEEWARLGAMIFGSDEAVFELIQKERPGVIKLMEAELLRLAMSDIVED